MLICKNAILGKAGKQAYAGYELGLDTEEIILVDRPANEVFNSESLSSLKGKTITLNHPDEDVSVDNHPYLAKGVVLDVRREGDLMIGDIKITDKEVIDLILDNEMVELSLGYETKLEQKNGTELRQKDIVYNHLALVRKGRAEVARIVDMETKTRVLDKQLEKGEEIMDKEKGKFSSFLEKLGLKKEEDGKYQLTDENKLEEMVKAMEENDENTEDPKTETKQVFDTETPEDTEDPEKDKDPKVEEKDINIKDNEPEQPEKDDKNEPDDNKEKIKDENKGDDSMSEFEKLMKQAQEIEKLQDEDFKAKLKDTLLKDFGVEDKNDNNDALNDFDNIKLDDSKVEKYDATAEIKKLYDDLNPHNYDTYGDYRKFRKKVENEAKGENIQELFEEAIMGGRK